MTIYSKVPDVVELELVMIWLILEPEPALIPLMPDDTLPIVQLNVLAALAVKLIPVLLPLQILFVDKVVTTGMELTVTVIVSTGPVQLPLVDTGVTMYCTLPALTLLGLVNA